MSSLLGLPPVPPELRNVSPYLQRADELKSKEPVVSYWAAYYAAQVGIALKPKEHASRTFLSKLLGLLEHLKTDIGPSDAVDNEAVSCAYIENFALRIFAAADNEDRTGAATRATAKKFLAAANFLEILRVFDKDAVGQSTTSANEEKIRYAKWKAADIAKAFREGRKPTPGPAASDEAPTTSTEAAPAAQVSASFASGTPSPPAITRSKTPPPHLTDVPSPQHQQEFQTPVRDSALSPSSYLRPGSSRSDPQSPGSWSTMATPGTPGSFPADDDESHTMQFASPTPSRLLRVSVSGELEGHPEDEWEDIPADASPAGSSSSKRAGHFTPSTMGGPPSAGPAMPGQAADDPFNIRVVVNTPSTAPTSLPGEIAPEAGLPPGFVPSEISPHPEMPPLDGLPAGFVPSPRVSAPPLPPATPPVPSLPSPPRTQAQFSRVAPPPPIFYTHSTPAAPISAPIPPPPVVDVTTAMNAPVQLTPEIVARAQKHCRFAISSLDYEDAEQAKKELRAALRVLGG
ncbi:DUF605-domain-containing protein [Obba rivulosa]|uniref:DUF605-domain-containing protein n=1 Tax=Obba rivulosa TaxID=1052685 RepID=A0A8E2DSE1_9APHY|nr:DUF605-domain-containing protein [Obba rivulosa]